MRRLWKSIRRFEMAESKLSVLLAAPRVEGAICCDSHARNGTRFDHAASDFT